MGCVSLPRADQLGGSKGRLIVEAFISFIIIVIGKRGRVFYFGEVLEEFWSMAALSTNPLPFHGIDGTANDQSS